MARLRAVARADDDLPDVSVLVGGTARPGVERAPLQKRASGEPVGGLNHITKATQHPGPEYAPSRSNSTVETTSNVTRATAKDSQTKRQRPLKHISGNSLLVPLATSEKASLSRYADPKDTESESRSVRQTPRRRAKHMRSGTAVDTTHEEIVVEEATSSPADASYNDEDGSIGGSESDDSLEAIKFWGGRNPRPTPRHRKTARRRCSMSPSPSPRRKTHDPRPNGQDGGDIIDVTSSPSPKKQLVVLKPLAGTLEDAQPVSPHSDHDAILIFSPPIGRSPRKAPPRPKTPPLSTPPPSPSKGKLLSPSKRTQRIATPPFRASIDAFWSATVVNQWNDHYSPKKDCLTSPRKKRFQDLLTRSSSSGSSSTEDGGRASPTMPSPRKSPTKRDAAKATRKKNFEATKRAIAEEFLHELDERITGGAIADLARATDGVKLVWSKRLNSTAGRANWRRETVRNTTTAADGSGKTSTTHHRHEASIELAEKVIDDEARLVNVVAHEFCHLANFMVSGVKDRPHGREFKRWAAEVSRAFGDRGVEVTTKHSYDIDYRYVWECEDCGLEFKRHSKSIDPARHSCGSCKSRLVQTKPKPRSAAASGYAGFVKEHFARVKKENPGVSHGAVMEMLGKLYKERKTALETPPSSESAGSESNRLVDEVADALGVVNLDD